jgi:hypothetical protein
LLQITSSYALLRECTYRRAAGRAGSQNLGYAPGLPPTPYEGLLSIIMLPGVGAWTAKSAHPWLQQPSLDRIACSPVLIHSLYIRQDLIGDIKVCAYAALYLMLPGRRRVAAPEAPCAQSCMQGSGDAAYLLCMLCCLNRHVSTEWSITCTLYSGWRPLSRACPAVRAGVGCCCLLALHARRCILYTCVHIMCSM